MNSDKHRKWLADHVSGTLNDLSLYERAFTHGSTGKADYQRLEFLGDRVLGLVVAKMVYEHFPEEPEGRLSHRLNGLVSGHVCAEVARSLGISDLMILGKQARDDGAQNSDNVLGDIMESLIGAIFVDKGLEAARLFIEKHWQPLMRAARTAPQHPKSGLQEWCAANNYKNPEYEITKKEGPPHNMRFEITVTVKGFEPVVAEGNSKQAAETAAAKSFLEQHK